MARIHVLGAGTPTPTPTRFGSSYVVELRDRYLMIDCGPATTYKMVRAGIWPTKVDHLFFTHHHFDHDVDYPCFLLCRWDQSMAFRLNRKSSFTICGSIYSMTVRICRTSTILIHRASSRSMSLIAVRSGGGPRWHLGPLSSLFDTFRTRILIEIESAIYRQQDGGGQPFGRMLEGKQLLDNGSF